MLTSKDAKKELVEGMEAGADDFMVKFFQEDELLVRIRAGERIIKLERELDERNRTLSQANRELSEAYGLIKKDLEAAAKIQASLLPKSDLTIQGVHCAWMFLPSTFVAGDILNYFKLDENHVGFYLLDVAGHGVPAALLSVTLSRVLSMSDFHDNIIIHSITDPPYYEIIPPAKVVQNLNRRFQADEDSMQYFTMLYGIINTQNGKTTIAQAGHPSPIFFKNGMNPSQIGSGGYPVGILPDVTYEENCIHMEPGDRLILYSDGITECINSEEEQFSVERLMELLRTGQDLSLIEVMKRIDESLQQWNGDNEVEDDMTLLAMEMLYS